VTAASSRLDSLRTLEWRPLLAIFALALAVRLVPAWLVYGSDDVANWHRVAKELGERHNAYATGLLNWPPLWPWVIRTDAKIASILGIPLHVAFKLGPIVADSAIAAVLLAAARLRGRSVRDAVRFSLLYVLNPVAIFTVAMHGQFDSFAVLFATLAVVAARWRPHGIASGLWVGLGAFAKTWPLVLLPGLLREGPWSRRAWVAYLGLTPIVIAFGTLSVAAPVELQQHVLDYNSAEGWWGLTWSPGDAYDGVAEWFAAHGTAVLYVALVAVIVIGFRAADPARLACALVLTFLVFTPGFGNQYLLWVLPIGLLADSVWARAYSALATVVLAVQYIWRPWNGDHFGFLSADDRSARFLADYGGDGDRLWTGLSLLPVWLLALAWLASLVWRIRVRGLSPARDSARATRETPRIATSGG